VNALELRVAKALFNRAEGLRGQEALPSRDDPNQLPFRLECENVARVQQMVFFADSADNLAAGGWT
jgi:hypothetical protein